MRIRKLLSRSALLRRLGPLRRRRKRIVFTNGCFDLLHAGHVRLLSAARRLGDVLVVGLNSDASVRRLKGDGRPVQPLRDRAEILAALAAVDFIVPFREDTPERLIRALRPEVLVKGADWGEGEIVGAEEVRRAGGRVVRVPLVRGLSTTHLIRRIRRR